MTYEVQVESLSSIQHLRPLEKVQVVADGLDHNISNDGFKNTIRGSCIRDSLTINYLKEVGNDEGVPSSIAGDYILSKAASELKIESVYKRSHGTSYHSENVSGVCTRL